MPAPDGVMALCGARRSTSGRKTRALSSGEPTASRTQAQEAERVLKKSHELMQAPQRLQQEDFSSTIDRDLNLSRGLGRPFGQAVRCATTIGPRLRRVGKKGRADTRGGKNLLVYSSLDENRTDKPTEKPRLLHGGKGKGCLVSSNQLSPPARV